MAMLLLGALLILAALCLGYLYLVNVLVGLAEPGHLTPPENALVISEGLIPLLLLVGGVVSLFCRTRPRLWIVVAIAAATLIDAGLSLLLYPRAMRSACLHYISSQSALGNAADTSCLTS